MKNLYLFLSLISIALTSCSSDDSTNPTNSSALLKKIIATSGNTTNTYVYNYNGSKLQSISINNTQFMQYTYSGNLIVGIKNYQSNNFLTYETIFTYDSNNRVTSEKLIDHLSNYEETKVFTYNPNNTVSYVLYDQSLNPTNSTGMIYRNASGQTTKIDHFNQGILTSTYEVTLDDKFNPRNAIVGFDKLPSDFVQLNNQLLTKITNGTGVETTRSEFVYTYNANNFVNTVNQKYYYYNFLQAETNIQYIY